VAIDAEFVSLQKEEAEIRSDGHRSTIKPAHMTCARVSLVYGSGPKKGDCFVRLCNFFVRVPAVLVVMSDALPSVLLWEPV
jgi:hypothetical protein